MTTQSPAPHEVLIQMRIPRVLADEVRTRAQLTGTPVNQWVRELIQRNLAQPELPAWSIAADQVGKDTALVRNFETGTISPHYLFVVREFAGDHLCVEVKGGPSQGKPPTEALTLRAFRARYENIRREPIFIRGSGFWSVHHIIGLGSELPFLLVLSFISDVPFDAHGVAPPPTTRRRRA